MNKILLVYDDYAELMSMEGTLKKVGFDVVGLSNEYSISQQIVTFNPDLIIAAGQTSKVSAGSVGRKLKETPRWHGKAVLIFPANSLPQPQDLINIRVDLVLEAPVFTERLLQVICKLLGHNESVILDRLHKSAHGDSSQRSANKSISGGPRFTTDKETFYVSGQVNEGGSGVAADKKGMGAEFRLNEEPTDQKISFKIDGSSEGLEVGSKSTEVAGGFNGVAESVSSNASTKVSSDELIGGGVPDVERIDKTIDSNAKGNHSDIFVVEGAESGKSIEQKAHEDLQKAQASAKARVAKYSEMTKGVQVSPISTVQKTEARRKQKEMFADVDRQTLGNIDKLKQEFTKALFKK